MTRNLRLDHSAGEDRPIHVVLAEDHETMRRTLRMVLDGEGDVDVVAEAADVPGALSGALTYRPDVLVLDLRMRGGSSIELIGKLHQQQPQTEVVVLTMLESPAFARKALEMGAIGFVVKDAADVELPEAVHRAAHHVGFTSPRVAHGLSLPSA